MNKLCFRIEDHVVQATASKVQARKAFTKSRENCCSASLKKEVKKMIKMINSINASGKEASLRKNPSHHCFVLTEWTYTVLIVNGEHLVLRSMKWADGAAAAAWTAVL